MLSAVPSKSGGDGASYFDEHLSQNDYYTQGQTQQGHWIGVGVERLGIKQGEVVLRETFLRLCENKHPITSKQLTPQQFKNRRIFFDFVCSAPKSVSILAVTMEDRRIVQAHREASELAIRELEQFAGTRIRKGGIEERDRVTGNLVGASFVHTTSRALDPQLHTHFVLFNATWDDREERWKALQTGDMFGALNYGTAVYRNELAKRLQGIGYALRQTASVFEIEGVDPRLPERFSKRSQQRDIAVRKAEERLGRKLTKKEIAHVVHQSRPKKLKDASTAEVRAQQLGELGFLERRSLRKVTQAAILPVSPPHIVRDDEAIDHAIAHVFERQSVAPQHRLLETALVKGCGQLALEPLKENVRADPRLVRVSTELSTRDILTKEIEALTEKVRAALKAQGIVSPQGEPVTVFDSLSWTQAQKTISNQYETGQRIRFVRPTRTFAKNETVEVLGIDQVRLGSASLRVRRPNGCEVSFHPSRCAACFDVGEACELKVAPGDTLLLQANAVAGRQRFINGERVQVKTIRDGRITLTDGRQLPGGFNTFTYGYAVTSHSSQSQTVDEVFLVASSRSFGAVNREQFYVSISRGRERVQVFTDDKELLVRRITAGSERKAAVELQALRAELAKTGVCAHREARSR